METFISIFQVVTCLVLIAIVLLQTGKSSGLGIIDGSSDTFLAKNKAGSFDAKLAKWTKWAAVAFIVLTLLLSVY